MSIGRGLLDTSVFIAQETRRSIDVGSLPAEIFVSVVTIAELEAGVLAAADSSTRALRLDTLQVATRTTALFIDAPAASAWARIRIALLEAGRRASVNDLWIAAVGLANDLPIVTQDDDFDALAELGLVEVVRV